MTCLTSCFIHASKSLNDIAILVQKTNYLARGRTLYKVDDVHSRLPADSVIHGGSIVNHSISNNLSRCFSRISILGEVICHTTNHYRSHTTGDVGGLVLTEVGLDLLDAGHDSSSHS